MPHDDSRVVSPRVQAVDLARGVALAGMMLAHLGPRWLGENPPVNEIISSGRAAPLFALLAGVSLTLVHRRDPQGAGSVPSTVLRGVLLVLIGLSLGSLRDMPVLVILAFYGLLIIAALPFRALPTRVLVGVTAAWAVLAPVGLLALRIRHEPVFVEQPSWSDVQDPGRLLTTVLLWGGYPAVVWIAYVLAGLVVGRLDLADRLVALRLAVGGLVVTAATLAIAYTHERDWRTLFARDAYPYAPVTWDELWVAGPHTSMPLNVIGAIGSAVMVVGACALLMRSGLLRRLATPVCAAGAMTLTLYTVHVLWTWRLWLDLDVVEGSWGDWVLQVLVLFAAATLWRRRFGRGPLEQLMRLLTVRPSARARSRDVAPSAPR